MGKQQCSLVIEMKTKVKMDANQFAKCDQTVQTADPKSTIILNNQTLTYGMPIGTIRMPLQTHVFLGHDV